MTRINLVDPSCLTTRHLVAEYKEITQFLHLVKKRVKEKHPMDDLPAEYTLNKGHCLYFFDKGMYIFRRLTELAHEMDARGIGVNPDLLQARLKRVLEAYSPPLMNEYEPNYAAYKLVIDRIGQRINEKPFLYPDKERFFTSVQKYLTAT